MMGTSEMMQQDFQVLESGLRSSIAELCHQSLLAHNVNGEDALEVVLLLSQMGHRAAIIDHVLDEVMKLFRLAGG